MSPSRPHRAQSTVVGTVLLVGVVTVLAATLSVVALGFGDETTPAAPVVGQSSGDLLAFEDGSDEQVVRLTHVAGDTLRVADLEIAVDATEACGNRGRIVNLPLGSGNNIDDGSGDGVDNIEGSDVFDSRSVTRFGSAPHVLLADTWSAGESVAFRLAKGACKISPGDRLVVRVVHIPSGAIVIEETLTATPSKTS